MQLIFIFFGFIVCVFSHVPHQPLHHRTRHQHKVRCIRSVCEHYRGPPVCAKWCMIQGSDNYSNGAKYYCCSYREKPGRCPKASVDCQWPEPLILRKEYQCDYDYSCPKGFKCCMDPCYVHKVCKILENQNSEPVDKLPAKTQVQQSKEVSNTSQCPPTPSKEYQMAGMMSPDSKQKPMEITKQEQVTVEEKNGKWVTDADAGVPEVDIPSPMLAHTKICPTAKIKSTTTRPTTTTSTTTTTESIPTEPNLTTQSSTSCDFDEEEILKTIP